MVSVSLMAPSLGSALDIRLRRETRRSRAFLQSVRGPQGTNKGQGDMKNNQGEVDTRSIKGKVKEMGEVKVKGVEEVVTDLKLWLTNMANFDSTGVAVEQVREIKPGVLQSSVSKQAERFSPMDLLDDEFYTYAGGHDANKDFHGNGVLEYEDGSYVSGRWEHGVREGYFKFDTNNKESKVNYFEGEYSGDELNGRVKIQLMDGTWMEGYFKNSVLHGFCRYFDSQKTLTFIGMHRNGNPFGTCWKIIKGGGCVVGRVNEEGKMTGQDLAYIYPDTRTAYVGTFRDGVLVSARASHVTDVILEYQSIKVPQFSPPEGDIMCREISTSDFVTKSPLHRDPYEQVTVLVRQSQVEGAQDGLFAVRPVVKGTILAFYNGIRRRKPVNGCYTWQTEANAYKIFDPVDKEGVVDIPEKFHDLQSYCASLAHKTNHSFIPNCEFSEFQHPRFGLVPCLVAIHDMAAGEEIFVWYGYDLDYCPDWYLEAWEKGNFTIPDSMKSEYGVS